MIKIWIDLSDKRCSAILSKLRVTAEGSIESVHIKNLFGAISVTQAIDVII